MPVRVLGTRLMAKRIGRRGHTLASRLRFGPFMNAILASALSGSWLESTRKREPSGGGWFGGAKVIDCIVGCWRVRSRVRGR